MRAAVLGVWIGLYAFFPAISAAQARSASAPSASESDVAKMQADVDHLLEVLRQQVANLPVGSPERAEKAKQLAAIEKQIRDQSRVRYVSPGTKGLWSGYRESVRRSVESYGAQHFPAADGHKLYGHLVMNMTIDQDGRLIRSEVFRSSGNPTLDQQALDLARGAGPFAPFDEALRRDADRVVITESFNFVHTE